MGVHQSKMAIRKTEKDFKQFVQEELKKQGAFVYLTIEAFRSGVPDLFVAKDGVSMWVELKWIQDGEALHHPLSLQQSKFLADYNNAGGVGCLLIGRASDQALLALVVSEVGIIKTTQGCTLLSSLESLWSIRKTI